MAKVCTLPNGGCEKNYTLVIIIAVVILVIIIVLICVFTIPYNTDDSNDDNISITSDNYIVTSSEDKMDSDDIDLINDFEKKLKSSGGSDFNDLLFKPETVKKVQFSGLYTETSFAPKTTEIPSQRGTVLYDNSSYVQAPVIPQPPITPVPSYTRTVSVPQTIPPIQRPAYQETSSTSQESSSVPSNTQPKSIVLSSISESTVPTSQIPSSGYDSDDEEDLSDGYIYNYKKAEELKNTGTMDSYMENIKKQIKAPTPQSPSRIIQ